MELMKLHTILIIAHVMALSLGLGAAVIADLTVARRALFRAISNDTIETMEFLGHLVTIGLALVWVTGIALVTEMVLAGGTILSNPKFWAKVVIVEVLTINAVAVHSVVLPAFKAQVGKRLFDGLTNAERTVMGVVGAISVTSWGFPVLLGTARELNNVVTMSAVLTAYGIVLIGVAVIAATVTLSLARKPMQADQQDQAEAPSLAQAAVEAPALAVADYSTTTDLNVSTAPNGLIAQNGLMVSSAPVASQNYQQPQGNGGNIDLAQVVALIAAYEQEKSLHAAEAAREAAKMTAQQVAAQKAAATQAMLNNHAAALFALDDKAQVQADTATQVAAQQISSGQFSMQDIAPRNELTSPLSAAHKFPMFSLPPLPVARPMSTAVLTPRPQNASAHFRAPQN
jgi:hypothetical protein